jgi:putative ABC transport system permease protein
MLRKTLTAFLLAIHNIRSHFFHTVLSVLGIVIGVAALVSILSLIDGMERYAKEQIAATTSLNAIFVSSQTTRVVNDVRIQRDTIRLISYDDFREMSSAISRPSRKYIRSAFATAVKINETQTIGAAVLYTDSTFQFATKVIHGRTFSAGELRDSIAVVVLNKAFVSAMGMDSSNVIGARLPVRGKTATVIGVVSEKAEVPQCFLPISLLTPNELSEHPPAILFEASVVTDVPEIKQEVQAWLQKKHPRHHHEFNVSSNEFRVEQAAKGFFLFRVIMGLIVGISVIVGGIGVMNVLLISVTERTSEIGIRKAVGATRKDIVVQFLSESVTISAFGSILGLILGISATMVIIPVVKALTKIPFQADYTLNTLAVISIVALAIGVIFGTYPALRASRLDPVEAIRRNE